MTPRAKRPVNDKKDPAVRFWTKRRFWGVSGAAVLGLLLLVTTLVPDRSGSDTSAQSPVLASPFISEVPAAEADKFVLLSPNNNTVLTKDTLFVKGVNRYGTAVFVDGVPVPVDPDGRFRHRLRLPTGKHVVVVSFVTPDYEVFHVVRQVIRRRARPERGENVGLSEDDMYFF